MRALSLATAAMVVASLGCDGVDTDPNIFAEVEFMNPTITVQSQALGTVVGGGFELHLHLGTRAADSTTIDVQGFELISEDENTIIVPSLPLSAVDDTLPILVEPGTDESVQIEIDLGNDLLEKEVGDNLCAFGFARYRGTIFDSLRGTSVPVLTDPVAVLGCAP